MSTALNKESEKLRSQISNSILAETTAVSRKELLGNRFSCFSEKFTVSFRQKAAKKTKLDQLEELGLLGAIKESDITSKNYKEFIKKSFKNKHGK